MLTPISITMSRLALETKKNKTLVSTTYIAYFGHGVEKFLNKKEWIVTDLLKLSEIGFDEPTYTRLFSNTCSLYYRDWSNVPTFGLWDKDYPTTRIVPNQKY